MAILYITLIYLLLLINIGLIYDIEYDANDSPIDINRIKIGYEIWN